MWIRRMACIVIGILLAVLAVVGLTAEIVPALGFAEGGGPAYLASKEISQWASDF